MIKKIDANKYGVVRYAISSIEDIADLPREVSVGSEAILVNEDGEKKFRLSSDGWVEVVEVKEYDEDKLRDILEDAKVGYGGIEYETLEERLEKDFDNAYSVLDNRTYVEYEGCRITTEDSLNGLQKETVIKGRTFQNLLSAMKPKAGLSFNNGVYETNPTIDPHTGFKTLGMIKGNTIYSLVIEFLEIPNGISTISVFGDNEFGKNYYISSPKTNTRYVVASTSKEVVTDFYFGYSPLNITEPIKFKAVLLEGDYRQNPLEEIPFIEGIESVGDKSKNLFDGVLEKGNIVNTTGENEPSVSSTRTPDFIKIKCPFTFSRKISGGYVGLRLYDKDKKFISAPKTNGLSITINEPNAEYVRFVVVDGTVDDYMIEEGTQATPYEPYYDGYKIRGKSCGKNLAKEISEENYVASGNGEVIFENNKCIAMDKTGWAGCFITGKETIKVKPNTTYYGMVECEEGAEYLSQMKLIYKCYDKNNNVITTIGTVTMSNNANYFYSSEYNDVYEAFLPIPDHYKYVKFSSEVHSVKLIFRPAGSTGTITNTFKNILFVETDKQPTYEPYKETTYSYILDEPLRSLPNGVCDEIDLEKGIVTRRVGKVVLGGTVTVTNIDRPVDESLVRVNISCETNKVEGMLICDSLPYFNIHNLPNGSMAIDFECICSHSVSNDFDLVLKVKKVGGYTLANFFNYIKNNPITVYYELANPTTEYLIKGDKFVTLPNGVKDEISHNSVLRKVGKIVLDGSSDEKWEVWGVGINFMFLAPITNIKRKGGNPLLCDAFKCLPTAIIDEEGVYNGETGWMGFKISRTKLKSGSIDELREWLALNPITVWYELETPYTEPINPNEVILDTIRLKSYEPITHITSDNYLPPTIKTQVPSDFNAVVLGLKSNNEALASQVMSLRQTNDELETTNREQDDVIDVTLLALDEVYGMIDEGEIETMSTGSPMVNVYVKMIKRGIKTLDEVPTKYRAEVEELI